MEGGRGGEGESIRKEWMKDDSRRRARMGGWMGWKVMGRGQKVDEVRMDKEKQRENC